MLKLIVCVPTSHNLVAVHRKYTHPFSKPVYPVEDCRRAAAYLSSNWVLECVCMEEKHCKMLCSAVRLKELYKRYGKHVQRF